MKPILVIIVALTVLLSGKVRAHQDTALKLDGGRIIGLPERYQPASFDREKKILTIAGKSLAFPKVLHALFTDDRVDEQFGSPVQVKGHPYQLRFSASWYHMEMTPDLPPYLLIKIAPENRDYSFELLVDLDRLRFIRADVQIASVGSIPIDLDGRVFSSGGGNDEKDGNPLPIPNQKPGK